MRSRRTDLEPRRPIDQVPAPSGARECTRGSSREGEESRGERADRDGRGCLGLGDRKHDHIVEARCRARGEDRVAGVVQVRTALDRTVGRAGGAGDDIADPRDRVVPATRRREERAGIRTPADQVRAIRDLPRSVGDQPVGLEQEEVAPAPADGLVSLEDAGRQAPLALTEESAADSETARDDRCREVDGPRVVDCRRAKEVERGERAAGRVRRDLALEDDDFGRAAARRDDRFGEVARRREDRDGHSDVPVGFDRRLPEGEIRAVDDVGWRGGAGEEDRAPGAPAFDEDATRGAAAPDVSKEGDLARVVQCDLAGERAVVPAGGAGGDRLGRRDREEPGWRELPEAPGRAASGHGRAESDISRRVDLRFTEGDEHAATRVGGGLARQRDSPEDRPGVSEDALARGPAQQGGAKGHDAGVVHDRCDERLERASRSTGGRVALGGDQDRLSHGRAGEKREGADECHVGPAAGSVASGSENGERRHGGPPHHHHAMAGTRRPPPMLRGSVDGGHSSVQHPGRPGSGLNAGLTSSPAFRPCRPCRACRRHRRPSAPASRRSWPRW